MTYLDEQTNELNIASNTNVKLKIFIPFSDEYTTRKLSEVYFYADRSYLITQVDQRKVIVNVLYFVTKARDTI